MWLASWIRSRRDAKVVEFHVESLVARNVNLVREATERRALALPHAEARGYIRAKATKILVDVIDSLSLRPGVAVPARLHAPVVTAASERLTSLVLEHRRRAATAPARQRRAA